MIDGMEDDWWLRWMREDEDTHTYTYILTIGLTSKARGSLSSIITARSKVDKEDDDGVPWLLLKIPIPFFFLFFWEEVGMLLLMVTGIDFLPFPITFELWWWVRWMMIQMRGRGWWRDTWFLGSPLSALSFPKISPLYQKQVENRENKDVAVLILYFSHRHLGTLLL